MRVFLGWIRAAGMVILIAWAFSTFGELQVELDGVYADYERQMFLASSAPQQSVANGWAINDYLDVAIYYGGQFAVMIAVAIAFFGGTAWLGAKDAE